MTLAPDAPQPKAAIPEPPDWFVMFGPKPTLTAAKPTVHRIVTTVRKVASKPKPKPRPKAVAVRKVPTTGYPATVAGARAYAKKSIGPDQFLCLDLLIEHESGWNPFSLNRRSGAYGLPQALPGSKMHVAGSDWRYNPVTQIRWVLSFYIPRRYGTACGAWHFWRNHKWY